MVVVQPSLLDLAHTAEAFTLAEKADVARVELGSGAWLDWAPGWLGAHNSLFERLLEVVAWRSERRPMYERVVDVPRLVAHYDDAATLPDPGVREILARLNERYSAEPGGPLSSVGMCCYRDGRDSVAWHGDRVGRGADAETVVAIVSLGAPRRLLVRPRGGGRSRRYELGQGDLFVMGGTCQRTFDHAVPKTTRSVGPRISLQFRQPGVR